MKTSLVFSELSLWFSVQVRCQSKLANNLSEFAWPLETKLLLKFQWSKLKMELLIKQLLSLKTNGKVSISILILTWPRHLGKQDTSTQIQMLRFKSGVTALLMQRLKLQLQTLKPDGRLLLSIGTLPTTDSLLISRDNCLGTTKAVIKMVIITLLF